jgi:predicted component of type VI protein secretion system
MKLQGWMLSSALLLSGCSLFFSSEKPQVVPQPKETVLTLSVGANSNLSPDGTSQPVKVCVWQRSQPGFIPASTLDGAPCRAVAGADSPFFSEILPPNSQRKVRFSTHDEATFWLVIAAEFQQPGRSRSLLEVRIPGKTDIAAEIRVERQTLFLQSIKRNQ